jgi:DNA gyrase subunit A
MKRSYLDYAMSVIVARALPDVRDGLKPVHRRILYAMHEAATLEQAYRKSARIVGDVMGKYHPHGDLDLRRHGAHGAGLLDARAADRRAGQFRLDRRRSAGGDALHRSAPDQGRAFAARRHRQGHRRFPAELRRLREREPTVLPARFPNLLVNGAGGIAVGMATNIPPHNLGEVIDACDRADRQSGDDDRRADGDRPGAGFPDRRHDPRPSGIRAAYSTGRGSIVMRGKDRHRGDPQGPRGDHRHRDPYQVNKATMIEKIAELVRDKRIEGISDLRDEATATAMRVVIELKRDASPTWC